MDLQSNSLQGQSPAKCCCQRSSGSVQQRLGTTCLNMAVYIIFIIFKPTCDCRRSFRRGGGIIVDNEIAPDTTVNVLRFSEKESRIEQ